MQESLAKSNVIHPRAFEEPTVADLFTLNPFLAKPEMPAREAVRILAERGFSSAPVIDAEGRPVGVVYAEELARAAQTSDDLLEPRLVRDVMSHAVLALPDTASISQAAALMAYEHEDRLPIVDSAGHVIGVLAATDLLGWWARKLGYLVPR